MGDRTERAGPSGRSRRLVRAGVAIFSFLLTSAVVPHQPHPELQRGRLLVASRQLLDPNFIHTVVLLLEYGHEGALGVVVNRPTTIRISTALPQIDELRDRPETLYAGGPVGRAHMLLLLHSSEQPEGATRILPNVCVSTDIDRWRADLRAHGKEAEFRAYAGHAGWGAGQLESEIERGFWHVAPGDAAVVFSATPERSWREIIDRVEGQTVAAAAAPSGEG